MATLLFQASLLITSLEKLGYMNGCLDGGSMRVAWPSALQALKEGEMYYCHHKI